MSISLAEVHRIAHLARIEVTEDEAERVRSQLTDIFAMIAKMQAVDTDGIEPMAHPLGGEQRLRDDAVNTSESREANMRNAPEQRDGLFLVPKVLE